MQIQLTVLLERITNSLPRYAHDTETTRKCGFYLLFTEIRIDIVIVDS